MYFIDEAKIYLQAGSGGNGTVSFRREKFLEFGGPDGGNGGKGGDIKIRTRTNISTLLDFRYRQHFKASNGKSGGGKRCTGQSADDIILNVPAGTQVYNADRTVLLADMTSDCHEFIIAYGGRGGVGNSSFKNSINQTPKFATPGQPGEELEIWLELKLISDVGLVGLPNAGKSTFLSVVSAAKPKIGDYPFTTLKPQLGVVRVPGSVKNLVIADIPGLIEGAHLGHGLGDRFLRHIERCKILLHLIDATNVNIVETYKIIRNELGSYRGTILEKHEVILLTKTDLLPPSKVLQKIKILSKLSDKPVFAISAISQPDVSAILHTLVSLL